MSRQVDTLDLSYNDGFESDDTDAVGKTVKRLQVRQLVLRFCSFEREHVKSLADTLEDYQQVHISTRNFERN